MPCGAFPLSPSLEQKPAHAALIRKLRSISPLSREETQCLLDLPLAVEQVGADKGIVGEGERPTVCCLLVEGFVCRYKFTEEG